MRRPQKEPGSFDFAFSAADPETENNEGFSTRFYEFTVEREAQQLGWLEALPPPRDFTVKGYLYKKRSGAIFTDTFELRYAVADATSSTILNLQYLVLHPARLS